MQYLVDNDLTLGRRAQSVSWRLVYNFMVEDRTSVVASTGAKPARRHR